MTHDDDVEWAKFIKGLIWDRFQARTIRDMEDRLQGTSSLLGAPMPNTCHPALSHQADFVRNFNQYVVQILGVLPKAMSGRPGSMTTSVIFAATLSWNGEGSDGPQRSYEEGDRRCRPRGARACLS